MSKINDKLINYLVDRAIAFDTLNADFAKANEHIKDLENKVLVMRKNNQNLREKLERNIDLLTVIRDEITKGNIRINVNGCKLIIKSCEINGESCYIDIKGNGVL